MKANLDLKIPENVNILLEEILTEIIFAKNNKKTAKLLFDKIKDTKFKNCIIRTGFVSGRYISFDCLCQKNGDDEIIKAIVKGMENKERDLFFMMGLNPKKLYINPDFIVDYEEDKFYVGFKLEKNDEGKKRKKNM